MAPSRTLAAAAVVAAGALLVPAAAQGALRADDVRIASDAAKVRVFVHFAGGPPLTGLERQVDAIDPTPLDGRAIVRVNAAGITSTAGPATGSGVTARVIRRPGNLLVRTTMAPDRIKFVSYRVSIPRNLLIVDLWRVTTDRRARILGDGCLSLTSWSGAGGRARAAGRELQPLFEHGLVLTVRGAHGSPISETPLIAAEGTFRPDFSGYAIPGRWRGAVAVPAASRGARVMLEAWSASAKDGSLECLVQTPARIAP